MIVIPNLISVLVNTNQTLLGKWMDKKKKKERESCLEKSGIFFSVVIISDSVVNILKAVM